jgi:subtilisin family serine protease
MLFAALAFLNTCISEGAQPSIAVKGRIPGNAVPGELIVKFKAGATDAQMEHGLKLGRLKAKRHLQTEAMHAKGDEGLTLTETSDPVDEVIERLKNHPAIEYVEPNLRYQHQATSNDSYVNSGYLWGLYGDLSSPKNTFGSQALEAWAAGYTGTNTVFVAVIDEGIDISHSELSPNIWTNPYDPKDGIDNDGNGYVDDIHGWDFRNNTNTVFDAAGDEHGTHVAGTIGAKGGNGSGLAGVNWNVTIMAGKFLGADGGSTLDAVEAIDYFVGLKKRHKINLVAINASWGGAGYSRALHEAVLRAAKAGILFIAAAGNDGLNTDISPSYPSNLDTTRGTTTESAATYDAVISVAAIDKNGALATFSNYGAATVDLGAPGVEILSTLPSGYLGYMNGTSMATPHVTGAAALYASTHPGASAQSIRAALLNSAVATTSLTGKTATGKRLDLSSVIVPPIAPPATVSAIGGNATVTLSWQAVPNASSYVLKRATQTGVPYQTLTSTATGTSYIDSTVVNGTMYFYVVAAVDSRGPGSDSLEVSATPKAAVSTFVKNDDAASGSWRGIYGSEGGLAIPYGTFALPAYVKLSAYHNYALTWEGSTTDPRALQKPSGSDRFATAWNSPESLYFYLNFSDTNAHRVSLYFVDYDRQGRDQLLEFFDNTTGKFLASERISNFQSGRYSTWLLQGNVRLRLTRLSGSNCVMSAIFFDSAQGGPFLRADSTTSGSWKGVYAQDGGLAYPYGIFVPPTYVQLSAYKNYPLLWSSSTTDPRALQKPTATDRFAGAWHSTDELFFYLQFKDAATHKVSFYFLDHERLGRQQKLEIIDHASGKVLDTRIIAGFENGVYQTFHLRGSVRLRLSRITGPNCVMSAIFFDPEEI